MTRHTAWHLYRQLARDGYRLEPCAAGVELGNGQIIYAVPRGHWSIAVRAVLSISFDERGPNIPRRAYASWEGGQ